MVLPGKVAVTSVVIYTQLVLILSISRWAEFAFARANTHRAFADGADEYDADHYPLLVAVWIGLYVGALLEVWFLQTSLLAPWGPLLLVLAVLAEGIRWWAAITLKWRWTNRVMVVPGSHPTDRGPYQYLRHPGDLAGLVLGLALPLAHGAWITAICFGVLYGVVLVVRLPVEEAMVWTHRAAPRESVTAHGPRR